MCFSLLINRYQLYHTFGGDIRKAATYNNYDLYTYNNHTSLTTTNATNSWKSGSDDNHVSHDDAGDNLHNNNIANNVTTAAATTTITTSNNSLRKTTEAAGISEQQQQEDVYQQQQQLDSSYNSVANNFTLSDTVLFVTFAILCGLQPLLVKWFLPTTLNRNVVILCQECIKLMISTSMLLGSSSFYIDIQDWTITSAIVAFFFVIQSHCNLFANQQLQPVTFVVLNQTKIVWTALCCYIILGQRQSTMQIIALILVILATLWLRKVLPIYSCCPVTSTSTITTTITTTNSNKNNNNSHSCISYHDNNNESQEDEMNHSKRSKRREMKCDDEDFDDSSNDNESDIDEIENENKNFINDNDGGGGSWWKTAKCSSSNNNNNNNHDDEDDQKATNMNIDNKKIATLAKEYLEMLGVIVALFAGFLSGLSGSITQLTLQYHDRNPHLFNVELAIFSSGFLILSIITSKLSSSVAIVPSSSSSNRNEPNSDNKLPSLSSLSRTTIRSSSCTESSVNIITCISSKSFSCSNVDSSSSTTTRKGNNNDNISDQQGGLFAGFTWHVWIPIIVQAFAGILVGLVTKHLGAVTKGFGNVFGIAISSILQQLLLRDDSTSALSSTTRTPKEGKISSGGGGGLSSEELIGACLCVVSLWLHVTNPVW